MRETVRLQKYLAERGVASRRTCAGIVRAGRVSVNGRAVSEPGLRVNPDTDRIRLDGNDLPPRDPSPRTIMLYKPRGYLCSRAGQGKTVYELLDAADSQLVPVGRLDKDSEGLLLLSNDGDLVHRLTHPRFEHEKVYRVTVSGPLDDLRLRTLNQPIVIDGARTRPAQVTLLRHGEKPGRLVLEIILKEGRKRQIRHLCSHAGLRVHRLVRTRTGVLTLKGLKPGQSRALSGRELRAL